MMALRNSQCLPRRTNGGFALLEVIVSMVILGVAIATLLRSFTLSLSAIRKNDATTQATVLAENLLQTLEADPPTRRKDTLTGDFESMGYPEYGYKLEVTNEKIKYRLKTNSRIDGLHDLKVARGTITYDDPRGDTKDVAEVYLVLSPIERFSFESKFRNELFTDDEGIP